MRYMITVIVFTILLGIPLASVKSTPHSVGASNVKKTGEIVGFPVHQYITAQIPQIWTDMPREWKVAFVRDNPFDTLDTVGEVKWDRGEDNDLGEGPVKRSGEEDRITHPIFAPPPFNSEMEWLIGYYRHFFDPDETWGTQGYLGNPFKAFYNYGLTHPTDPLLGVRGSSYRLAEQYLDSYVYPLYFEGLKNNDPYKIREALYYAGSIAHLFEDLAVPDHVHNDPHYILRKDSTIEKITKNPDNALEWLNGAKYTGQAYDFPGIAQKLEEEQKDFQWTHIHPVPAWIFKDMWITAQMTQYFPSTGDYLSDNSFARGDGGAYSKLTDAELRQSVFSLNLWEGIVDTNKIFREPNYLKNDEKALWAGEVLAIHALRAAAGFFKHLHEELENIRLADNTNCASAYIIESTPFFDHVETYTAPNTAALISACVPDNALSHALWYRFMAPTDGYITIKNIGSTFKTLVSVFEIEGGCTIRNETACQKAPIPELGWDVNMAIPVLSGHEYFIIASSLEKTRPGILDLYIDFSETRLVEIKEREDNATEQTAQQVPVNVKIRGTIWPRENNNSFFRRCYQRIYRPDDIDCIEDTFMVDIPRGATISFHIEAGNEMNTYGYMPDISLILGKLESPIEMRTMRVSITPGTPFESFTFTRPINDSFYAYYLMVSYYDLLPFNIVDYTLTIIQTN